MKRFIKILIEDESGTTAVEYGIIASLVSIAAITGFEAMGASFSAMFGEASSEMNRAVLQAGSS